MRERDRASAAAQRPLRRLASRLLDEQRARWERGDEAPAEEFLRQHPELQADPEALVDRIYQEVLLQQEHGRVLGLSDCVRRFPQCEALLKAQFAVHEVLQCSRWDGSLPWLSPARVGAVLVLALSAPWLYNASISLHHENGNRLATGWIAAGLSLIHI